MRLREAFVQQASEPGVPFASVCRQFGISRKTGYKWMLRYKNGGLAALEDQPRRPKLSPLGISAETVTEIIAIRVGHPSWGAKKIAAILEARGIPLSVRTAGRVLEKAGLVRTRKIRPRRPKAEKPDIVCEQPNDLWTIDFKGWWINSDRRRCEPLTIRDAHSRFILAIRILDNTTMDGVREVLEDVFTTYGLPKAILTDNGPPFAANNGRLRMTKLSVWWTLLGIKHLRSRPATPGDNGAHERMHRDMKQDIKGPEAKDLRNGIQSAWDLWRNEFNTVRPHEALAMKTPATLYRRSPRAYDSKPVMLHYPENFDVRVVDTVGKITLHRNKIFLSYALRATNIGLEPKGRDVYDVWLADQRLGKVDLNRRPAILEVE